METLEVAGLWWMPTRPDHKVPGILTFDLRKAGLLTLIGGLRTPRTAVTPAPMVVFTESARVIHSHLTDASSETSVEHPAPPTGKSSMSTMSMRMSGSRQTNGLRVTHSISTLTD